MNSLIKNKSSEKKQSIPDESPRLKIYLEDKKIFFLLKRASDVVLSLIVICCFLTILFPIIAILIKLESRGPVLFIQRRVGYAGKSFLCYKFRTMVPNSAANTLQASENDLRITEVGRFLRKTNLDEFPQFFNVLLGHMSIVGPRPHMYSDCARFSLAIPSYKFRSIVKPGITGLAQTKGLRGPTQDFKSMFHRYQFDAFYVRNANFWMDLRIIRQTAAQTFRMLVLHLGVFVSVRLVEYKKCFNSIFL